MPRALDPTHFEALTFDCYGTLIDWLGGVTAAVRDAPSLAGCDVGRIVRERDAIERELEAGEYEPYSEVLRRSLRGAAALQGRELTARDADAFARSISTWKPFGESTSMLRRLARRYRLAILSNIEDELLRASIALLDAPFECYVTAEQVRSYKPAHAHFDEGLRRLDLPRERVLHVACSWYHDVAPTLELGWSQVWVNREGEPAPAGVAPALETRDLGELVRALRC